MSADTEFILNIELPTTMRVMASDWKEAKKLGQDLMYGMNIELKSRKELIDKVVRLEVHDMHVDEVLDKDGNFPEGSLTGGEEE